MNLSAKAEIEHLEDSWDVFTVKAKVLRIKPFPQLGFLGLSSIISTLGRNSRGFNFSLFALLSHELLHTFPEPQPCL